MEDLVPPATEPRTTSPGKKLEPRTPVQSKRSGWRWLWLPVLLLAGTGAWYLWSKGVITTTPAASGNAKGSKKGGGTVPVVAVKAYKGSIRTYIDGLGSVTPLNTVMVKSRVDGQLMNVHFKEGDILNKGDLLVEIDPRPFNVALEQADAQKAKDEANLKNARRDLERYTGLLALKAVPEQTLTTQQATVDQDEAVIKTDEAMIDTVKLNLVYCNIRAEVTGRVGLRLVDPGNIVHATDTNPMLVITQIQPISAIFTVAEDDLQKVLMKVAAGQHLLAEAWDRGNTIRIGSGTLGTVDNQVDPSTGTLRLRALFDNTQNQLFPNQFVQIHLLVQEDSGVTLVNRAAIQLSSNGNYAFVVKPDRTVTVRQVVVGQTEGDNQAVKSGLEPGDTVVMTGIDKLQEGTPVNVQIADETKGGKSGGGAATKSGGPKK